MNKVIVIAGVTATGKSQLALRLAQEFNAEIVSVDSVSVYRELNIGSAKPSLSDQALIPHHLINVCSYQEAYHVARFQKEARTAIAEIISRGKNVIIVGGTGLYLNALIKHYYFAEEPVPIQTEHRSNETLYNILKVKDPEHAQKIHPNNRQRLIRAVHILETHQTTQEITHQAEKDKPYYDAYVVFLYGERDLLYTRINDRVEKMMHSGLLEEVTNLYQRDPHLFSYPSMKAIGYREFASYFAGQQSLEETVALIQKHTRQFAKRQMTWFRHQTPAHWYDIETEGYELKLKTDIKTWLDY